MAVETMMPGAGDDYTRELLRDAQRSIDDITIAEMDHAIKDPVMLGQAELAQAEQESARLRRHGAMVYGAFRRSQLGGRLGPIALS